MSEHAPKPSLAAMPPELLGQMTPHPGYTCSVDVWPKGPWLAISTKRYSETDYYGNSTLPKETLMTLRALSQTCRSLREFTLPILWSECHISRITELSRLRETLRVSPCLAGYVRSFLVLCAVPNSEECITEIVSQLTSLKTVAWTTKSTPMPLGTFRALAKLTTLQRLHVDLKAQKERGASSTPLPFWNISGQLEVLSLNLGGREPAHMRAVIDEQDEATLTSLEALSPRRTDDFDCDAFNVSTACRMIIAAARGGHLRGLTVKGLRVEPPFAVRALMPYWVQINFWNLGAREDEYGRAAESLRPLLAHASMWHGVASSSSPKADPELTSKDIQALARTFRSPACHIFTAQKSGPEFHLPSSVTSCGSKKTKSWLSESQMLGTLSLSRDRLSRPHAFASAVLPSERRSVQVLVGDADCEKE